VRDSRSDGLEKKSAQFVNTYPFIHDFLSI
jgi:hypothetical protein